MVSNFGPSLTQNVGNNAVNFSVAHTTQTSLTKKGSVFTEHGLSGGLEVAVEVEAGPSPAPGPNASHPKREIPLIRKFIKKESQISDKRKKEKDSAKKLVEQYEEEKIMKLNIPERNRLFEKTVKSKTVLSFGYLSFCNLMCLRLGRVCLKFVLCGCCTTKKYKKRLESQHKHLHRNSNASAKLRQEFDILNIVRDLRVAKFFISLSLTPHQQ